MKPIRIDLKAAFALVALSAAGLLAAPAHAGLLGNGSFESLVIADGANCPGVALGKSCIDGVGAKQQPDGSEVASLLFKADSKSGSDGAAQAASELTVTFFRDSFSSAGASRGAMDSMVLVCAANPEICRNTVYGASGATGSVGAGMGSGVGTSVGTGVALGVGAVPGGAPGAAAGGASAALGLGFMQSVSGVQVSSQYGLSFLQANTQVAARSGDTSHSASSPERWEVTYGASSQPAAAVTSVEGVSSGWSSSGLQFQSTSTTQVQSYMASGPSGLMGGGVQTTPMVGVPWSGRASAVPEPGVLVLVGVALWALCLQRRRQTR